MVSSQMSCAQVLRVPLGHTGKPLSIWSHPALAPLTAKQPSYQLRWIHLKALGVKDEPALASAHHNLLTSDQIDNWPKSGPSTPLLDTIAYPKDLKSLSLHQLLQVCDELRADIIHTVAKTGGHLGGSLGCIELTVALHYVFDAPDDKLIWDSSHVAYGHKILTGRRDRMHTLRQTGGLSGFTKRSESIYDPFSFGHVGQAVSACVGMAVGRDLKAGGNECIAVIGDGCMTAGIAFEALNHAGFLDSNMIVILNDNQQVSLPTQYNNKDQKPFGALSRALADLSARSSLQDYKELAERISKHLPMPVQEGAAAVRSNGFPGSMTSGSSGAAFFEALGQYYVGPLDGHDLEALIGVLEAVKSKQAKGPVILHVITEKGKGYPPAESAPDRMHGVGKYDPVTGKPIQGPKPKADSYSNIFADALIAEAERDARVVGIHAAMGGGTGMNRFEARFEKRTFDVGIAEQHAVAFAAALAIEGLVPFVAIYSSMLQRAYDQVVHDVCMQSLPVRFAMDRAGLVGPDGPTHSGFADVAFMGCLPGMVLMAPSNEAELCNAVATAALIDDRPSCFRFPRGNGLGVDLSAHGVSSDLKGTPWEVGKGIVRRSGKDIALLGYGMAVNTCLAAAELLAANGISATVADMRFCKPLDGRLVREMVKNHPAIITVEEGSMGGFGSHVLQYMHQLGLLDRGGVRVRTMTLPDRVIEHGSPGDQLSDAGLSASQVAPHAANILSQFSKVAALL